VTDNDASDEITAIAVYENQKRKRHIVLTLKFGFDEEVLYIGNVVDNKSYD